MTKESAAMKMLMAVFVTAVALCAFSTWMSWVLEQVPEQERHAQTPHVAIPRTTQLTTETHGETVTDRTPEPLEPAPPLIDTNIEPTRTNVDSEEPFALSGDINERLQTLRDREAKLLARQEAMTLIHADIRDERAAIEEIRRRMTHELNGVLRQAHEQNPESESSVTSDAPVQPNVLRPQVNAANSPDITSPDIASAAHGGADSEKAAAIVQTLADNGRIDVVVKLLSVMNERLAAKVLTAVSGPNPDMAMDLSEMIQQRKLLHSADAAKDEGDRPSTADSDTLLPPGLLIRG